MTNKLFNVVAPVVMLVATMLPVGASAITSPAPTATPLTECSVISSGTTNTANQANSRFTVNTDEVAGKFTVSGPATCKVKVTIATWQAPDGNQGKPYSAQKLWDHYTASYGPGEHTIITDLPHCFFQVDLLRGDQPTAPDGSPVYPAGWLMGSLHGGTQVCSGMGGGTPTPTPTPTPTTVPTVTPTPTPTTKPTSSPTVLPSSTEPTSLPDTGSAVGGAIGLVAMIGSGYVYWRQRRNAKA